MRNPFPHRQSPARKRHEELTRKITKAQLSLDVLEAKVESTRTSLARESGLRDKIEGLKTEIASLRIDKSRLDEENARTLREVEHKVALHKAKVTQETELASRKAVLEVREENLATQIKTFDERMDFMLTQFRGEQDRGAELMNEILKRLPNINVELDTLPTTKPSPRRATK